MTAGFLVIVGLWGIGIERCWNRLYACRWYACKSNFVKFYEALFKANNWSFDLKSYRLVGMVEDLRAFSCP